MYKEKDKVYYPPHGAGVVQAILPMDFGGEERKCYCFYIPHMEMTIYLPLGDEKKARVRDITPKNELLKVLETLKKDGTEDDGTLSDENWLKRHNSNFDKVKTGDPYLVASVIKSLTIRARVKRLPHSDKQVLDQAKAALASEIMVLYDMKLSESVKIIEKKLRNHSTILDCAEV